MQSRLSSLFYGLYLFIVLAFGTGNEWIGDFSKVMMAGVTKDALVGTIPESLFAMFQLTFAIITPALIIGGFAERMRFFSSFYYSASFGVIIVYAPITHWVWGGGWLQAKGLLDFCRRHSSPYHRWGLCIGGRYGIR